MNVQAIDHLNLRVPEKRVDDFVGFYRDVLGLSIEHLDAYRTGEKPFFYVRLTEETVLHVSPTESFSPPEGDGFDHVALFVDEPRSAVRERIADSEAEVVEVVEERLGATGSYPSIYVEDPVGYVVELKSRTT